MKRLFRTSKSTVDPLPPPSAGAESHDVLDAHTPRSAQYYSNGPGEMASGGRPMANGTGLDPSAGAAGGMPRKSGSGLKLDAYGHPTTPGSASEPYQHHQQSAPAPAHEPSKGKSWFSYNNPSVTPFPIDLGGPVRRLSRKEKKDKAQAIPTMAEMNARNAHADERDREREREREARMVPPPLPPVREGQRSRGNSGAPGPVQGGIPIASAIPQRLPAVSNGAGAEGGRPRSSSRFYEGDIPSELRPAPPPKSPQAANHHITLAQAQSQVHRQSPDPYSHPHSRQASPPLPIPSAPAMQGRSSGRSSPTQQNFYLPPGARPPTPPGAVRASTPTRPPFAPSSMGHSHTSVLSQSMGQGGYLDLEGRDQEWERDRERIGREGRDRGYSSASGSMRGSDVESSLSHAQHGGRTSKPSSHAHAHTLSGSKSPLAQPQNAYVSDPSGQALMEKPRAPKTSAPPSASGGTLFPTPQPHAYALPPGAPSPYSPMSDDGPIPDGQTQNIQYSIPVSDRPYEDHLDQEMRALQIQEKERAHVQSLQQGQIGGKESGKDKDKEKKKFWGMDMGWAGKRDKEKDRDRERKEDDKERERERANMGANAPPGLVSPQPQYAAYEPQQDRRGSDWSDGLHKGLQGMFSGQHRHRDKERDHAVQLQQHQQYHQAAQQPPNGPAMLMEDEQRGRMAGRMHFTQENQDPTKAKDVGTAINLLCHNPDPSFSAVYAVCERIRLTDNVENAAKDAARAIRKQFKHGNEAERRAATVVWLLMMRNLSPDTGFQVAASSKKFLSNFEPLLFAPPSRPLVNQNTHRIMLDVLGDLTYNYSHEKGCEALTELWRKTGPPVSDEGGRPLPDDHPIFHPEAQFPTNLDALQRGPPAPYTYPNGAGRYDNYETRSNGHQSSHGHGGPGYANLPSHTEDIRRLMEECTAAKESARVLAEALVFTRPEDLDGKPIIQEFYKKCFNAHQSLTNQMGWAQAEASRSHERTQHGALSLDVQPDQPDRARSSTIEEEALAALFEAHAALAEAIKQHDELSRMAMEHRELSEVRERSKKDTRMGRDDPARLDALGSSLPKTTGGFLAPGMGAVASSSRSPSPAAHPRLPPSPRNDPLQLPPAHGSGYNDSRSRTPSPDSLPHPQRIPASPNGHLRPASPLGQGRIRGSRPLPVPGSNNPFRSQHASNASLNSSSGTHGAPLPGQGPTSHNPFEHDPAKLAAGLTAPPGTNLSGDEGGDEDEAPRKPSRKALGKRRAEPVDPDNDFDPHDLLMGESVGRKQDNSSSEESITADDVFFSKPVKYVYDAYQEKLDAEARAAAAAAASGGKGGSGSGGGGTSSAAGEPRVGGGSGSTQAE